MQRGLLPNLLEDGIPTLVLAAVVLLGGMGYGFYVAHQRPATPVPELQPSPMAPDNPMPPTGLTQPAGAAPAAAPAAGG